MPVLIQTCRVTGKTFEVNEWEQKFLKKMDLPLPTLCIEERHRRRMAHRNEHKIYNDVCDLTGKPTISIYSPDKNLKVYSQEAWWSDHWDQYEYGRDFDFSRPFFEQFLELRKATPRLSLMNSKGENSAYCNVTVSNKNCYLVFGGDFNEDCLYSSFNMHSRDVSDVYWVNKSELMYECIDCGNCYNVKYSQSSFDCSDSAFLFECRSCKNCFGCFGLKNKEYYIFNRPYSKEEYHKKIAEFRLDSWSHVENLKKEFGAFKLRFPHRYAYILNSENVTGDHITNASNCFNCYAVEGPAQDLKDVFLGGWGIKDSLSSDHLGHNGELCYEVLGAIGSYNCAFCTFSFNNQNIFYCDMIANSHDLFGCTNMKRAQYCILNKQYSEKEYFDLRKKIIEHMKKTGEWGEFFPLADSLFGYNETVAQDYFPLTKEEALQKGLVWLDEEKKTIGSGSKIPDSINDVTDEILQMNLVCEKTGRPYKIIPQELKFYRKMGIPLPHYAFETRNEMRIKMRNPIMSWTRNCAKCGIKIATSYAPERPEIIYCEACYLQTIY